MNIFYGILLLLMAYIIYSQVKKSKKRKAEKEKTAWLAALQKAHNTDQFSDIIKLMDGKEADTKELCYVLGNALLSTGATEQGRTIFRKAIFFGDKNETRKVFGFSELNNGNYKEAVSLLQEIEKDYLAIEFKYDTGYDIIENLGIAFSKLGKYDLAIEALKGAPLGKKNIVPGLNSIFILLAECYEKNDDKKNAIKFLNKSLTFKYSESLQAKVNQLTGAQ